MASQLLDATKDHEAVMDFVTRITNDPSLLYRNSAESKDTLLDILQSTFSSYLKARGSGKKRTQVQQLALKGFGLDQIWAQIEHHTSSVNDKLIKQLTTLMADDDFLKNIVSTDDDDEDDQDEMQEGDSDQEEGEEEGIDGEYGDEDEDDAYKFAKSGDASEDDDMALEINEKKDGLFDKNEDDSEVEEFMENLELDEMVMDGLKLPSDAEEDDDEDGPGLDDYDDEEDFEKRLKDDFQDSQEAGSDKEQDGEDQEEDEEAEIDDVFAKANENQEMDLVENLRRQADDPKNKDGQYMNADLVKKIEQIEDEMMNPKAWQLTGEATSRERPVNSLLDVQLDFNAATKLPPIITKEVTIKIEELIKQRVLDELFDDPVLLNDSRRKRLNKTGKEMDFTKSKKGLGDLYAEDMASKLLSADPEAFLEAELNGPDAPLKREIEDISKDLFQNLDTLSNFHYTPKGPKTEANIQSQNVPALMLEDAIPIDVSKGKLKTVREVLTVDPRALREKTELTKEEKRKERTAKKRKVKAAFKHKATQKKEQLREQGLALATKFAVRETQRQMEKMSKKNKGKKGGSGEEGGRRTNSSAKVFANMQKIVAADYKKKEDKKEARESGKKFSSLPTHGQASKRFKL